MNTFAILEIGASAYDEISRALKKAGYSVERDGEINMEGIHLKRKESAINLPVRVDLGKARGGLSLVGHSHSAGVEPGETEPAP